MKGVTFILMLFFLLGRPASAESLSTFAWDDETQREGLRISGAISWDPKACDFNRIEHTHVFPMVSNKKPSGKPFKDPNGAYCLRVDLPPEKLGQTISISMIRVYGNAELRINETQVWSQDDNTGPRRLHVLHDVQSTTLFLELRLSCNQSPTCGFRGGLHIDDQRQGIRREMLNYSYDLLAIMVGLSCFFYHIIFAFLRRRSSAALFLAFNCLALILRITATGQGQIQYFIPWTEDWYWRFETLAVFILLPSTISLVRSVFEEEASPNYSTLGWAIALTGTALMVFNARIYLFIVILVYTLIALNLVVYALIAKRAACHRRSGLMIFVICSLINIASTTVEALNSRFNIEMSAYLQPLGYVITMIFQSVLLATRINDAFVLAGRQETEIKGLKEKIEFEIQSLDQRILERTAELRTIFQSISTGILRISTHEEGQLHISSEYSDHLRETIGFDIQSWHEMHFFLRRLGLPQLPKSGHELATWFQQIMSGKESLDAALEHRLGGLRVFNDMEHTKHLKFKWVTMADGERIGELFIFVFDVSLSMEMQTLAQYKNMEIVALRELTAQSPDIIDGLIAIFEPTRLGALQTFARERGLPHLHEALSPAQSAEHIEKFMQAYRRVLNLLHERQSLARQQKSFDLTAFLQLPDWQNLPVDARDIFRDIQKNRKI